MAEFGTFKVDVDIKPFEDAITRVGRGARSIGIAFEISEEVVEQVEKLVAEGVGFEDGPMSLDELADARALHVERTTTDIAFMVLLDEAIKAKTPKTPKTEVRA